MTSNETWLTKRQHFLRSLFRLSSSQFAYNLGLPCRVKEPSKCDIKWRFGICTSSMPAVRRKCCCHKEKDVWISRGRRVGPHSRQADSPARGIAQGSGSSTHAICGDPHCNGSMGASHLANSAGQVLMHTPPSRPCSTRPQPAGRVRQRPWRCDARRLPRNPSHHGGYRGACL